MAKKAPKASEVLPILLDAPKGATVDDLAQHLINQCGGTAAFAAMYVTEMQTQKGVAKARMLEGVMRIVTSSSTLNKKLGHDESDMVDEDLLAEAAALIEKGRPDAAA